MVLTLKRWKSRTPPGIVAGVSRGKKPIHKSKGCPFGDGPFRVSSAKTHGAAGWSSPVARQAHNLKVVGSNPTPATKPRKSPAVAVGLFVFRRAGRVGLRQRRDDNDLDLVL